MRSREIGRTERELRDKRSKRMNVNEIESE